MIAPNFETILVHTSSELPARLNFGNTCYSSLPEYFAVPFPLQNTQKLLFVFIGKKCRI